MKNKYSNIDLFQYMKALCYSKRKEESIDNTCYFNCKWDKFKLELSVLFRNYIFYICFNFIFVQPFRKINLLTQRWTTKGNAKFSHIQMLMCAMHISPGAYPGICQGGDTSQIYSRVAKKSIFISLTYSRGQV